MIVIIIIIILIMMMMIIMMMMTLMMVMIMITATIVNRTIMATTTTMITVVKTGPKPAGISCMTQHGCLQHDLQAGHVVCYHNHQGDECTTKLLNQHRF